MFRRSEQAAAEPVLPVSAIPLKGVHNLENVLAAVTVARLAGISAEVIEDTVRNFRAVEHRLEFVAEIAGVRYYNDSKATNVDAAAKAIAAFDGGIHLILGGKDKDSDYSTLIPLLKKHVRVVYTIGAAAEKIESQLNSAVPVLRAGTLARALEQASTSAQPGDTVLLAPACSSFDQFRNYEQRGEQFKQAVQAMQQGTPQGASLGV